MVQTSPLVSYSVLKYVFIQWTRNNSANIFTLTCFKTFYILYIMVLYPEMRQITLQVSMKWHSIQDKCSDVFLQFLQIIPGHHIQPAHCDTHCIRRGQISHCNGDTGDIFITVGVRTHRAQGAWASFPPWRALESRSPSVWRREKKCFWFTAA